MRLSKISRLKPEDTYLNLLGQRNNEALIEFDDAIHVDLFTPRPAGIKVLSVGGRFLAQTVEQGAFDVGLGDERSERVTVACDNGLDEECGVASELGL